MLFRYFSKTIIAVPLIILLAIQDSTKLNQPSVNKTAHSKETYIPAKVWMVPDHNNYNSDTSQYSYSRKLESDNIAIFWAKEFGADPMQNPDSTKRFNVQEVLAECERFYEFYVNDLKIVQKGKSLTDKYKILFYVIGGNEQTAFGGGEEDKIGILWAPAVRIRKAPYGALAHELGHAFQYIAASDNGTGPHGAIMEMSAQYMLWQVYPEWMTFENYHLTSFMKKNHFAFLHPTNMYHTPYVIEYWSNKHGIDFFGKLLRNTQKGEDPVMTYKRITGITQEQFNDEIFDASARFITWDMKRIEKVASKYANQHATILEPVEKGWYQIAESNCPQNYGYNGIKLRVPKAGTTIQLSFKGIAGASGFRAIKTDKAGWRYGFLAVKKDGSRVYGKAYSNAKGKVMFTVPDETAYLWLVVSGAPKEHWEVSGKDEDNEQWPYRIKLSGTGLEEAIVK